MFVDQITISTAGPTEAARSETSGVNLANVLPARFSSDSFEFDVPVVSGDLNSISFPAVPQGQVAAGKQPANGK